MRSPGISFSAHSVSEFRRSFVENAVYVLHIAFSTTFQALMEFSVFVFVNIIFLRRILAHFFEELLVQELLSGLFLLPFLHLLQMLLLQLLAALDLLLLLGLVFRFEFLKVFLDDFVPLLV